METTDWDSYGTGRYEKCANCMAHCGYEPTAATAALNNPLKTMSAGVARRPDHGPDGARDRPQQAASGAVHLCRAGSKEVVRDPEG